MIKIRVIPILNLRGSTVVKSVQFDNHRMVGDGATNVKLFSHRMADEMVIVDIDASRSGVLNPQITERLAKECMMPLTVGGGVLTSAHADTLFRVGADKVVVNTGFFENRDLVEKISRRYGVQAVVVSLDYRNIGGRRTCYSHSGSKNTEFSLEDAVRRAEGQGAGEVLINSIDNDGMMKGYDLEALEAVVDAVDIPIVIAGGCGSKKHCVDAVKAGASAVAGGSVFFWIGESIRTIKAFMDDCGLEVRLM